MRFSQSTHLLMCLSLETLTSIIRTGWANLVEMIDLVNFLIIFLSQIILLKWLIFLLRSLTVTLSSTLLDLFLSSDAGICSTMAFPQLGNSNHVVASVSIDFLSNSKRDALFHCIVFDNSVMTKLVLIRTLSVIIW